MGALRCGAIEGSVVGEGRGLPVLEAGPVPATGAAPDYAAGEEPRPPEGAPTATANHELL